MRGLAQMGSLIAIVLASTVFGAEDAEKLWAAARKGDAKTVQELLASGADVNARTEYGATALWFAAFKGQTEVVRVLLKHHADMSALDSVWGQAPLDLAVEGGHLKIVKELLRAGAPG